MISLPYRIPHQSGTLIMYDDPTGTHYYLLVSMLRLLLGVVRSIGFGQWILTCICHCSIMSLENRFPGSRIHCAQPTHPPFLQPLTASVNWFCRFPTSSMSCSGITRTEAFRGGSLSLQNAHSRLITFHRVIAYFSLVLASILFPECVECLSTHLLKSALVAFK